MVKFIMWHVDTRVLLGAG